MPWEDWDALDPTSGREATPEQKEKANKHRALAVLFGDGAGALLFRATDREAGLRALKLHTDGGAAYVQYQFTPKIALGSRAEYMSDRGALFSGISQALKENTVTFDYRVADGLLMRYEWRRDFSNQPTFFSDVQGVLKKDQNTATLGLVWWWGRKEGSW